MNAQNKMVHGFLIARGTWLLNWVFLLIAVTASAQSGNKGGRSGAQFLEIGVGARAVGMGETFIAMTDDASSTYYNPAGLGALKGFEATFSTIQWPADITYNFAAAAMPVTFLGGSVGFQIGRLTTGEMLVRTPLRPEGTGQKFEAANFVTGLSYARSLTDKFTFGLSVKYVRLDAFRYRADGLAMDLGSTYRTGFKSFRFGWVISNFGPDLKFINETFSLPTSITFGIAAEAFQNEVHTLTLTFQGNRPNDNQERASVGMEYWFKDLLALRGGYRINYDADRYSFGIGIRVPVPPLRRVQIDYAYTDMSDLNQVNRFSVTFGF